MSEENSTSDIPTETTEDSKAIEISQVHNVLNKSSHDEADSPTVKHATEFELPKESGKQNIVEENKFLSTNFKVEMENREVEDS